MLFLKTQLPCDDWESWPLLYSHLNFISYAARTIPLNYYVELLLYEIFINMYYYIRYSFICWLLGNQSWKNNLLGRESKLWLHISGLPIKLTVNYHIYSYNFQIFCIDFPTKRNLQLCILISFTCSRNNFYSSTINI